MTRTRLILPEKVRWHVAYLLDRLPGQCWADLVSWVLGRSGRWSPWSPVESNCHRDRDATGVCYCGKLGRREPGEVPR